MLLLAEDAVSTFCEDTANIWQLVGRVVTVFKIVIPVILIILGTIDLGKAVIASDDKAIKSATTALIKRIIAGIVIFFIPTIVKALFNLFTSGSEAMSDAKICVNCIASPGGDCDGYAKNASK